MRKGISLILLSFIFQSVHSQKPALDHSVYDGWESIGDRAFSPDGKYLIYTVVPQEGDGRLVIRSTEGSYAKEIPRGAMAAITPDSRWVVLHIKPHFKDTREARIKKKTPDQMPKDTLAWRLAQFFGFYLKGEPPARWIKEGVPATMKGIDWGLGTD